MSQAHQRALIGPAPHRKAPTPAIIWQCRYKGGPWVLATAPRLFGQPVQRVLRTLNKSDNKEWRVVPRKQPQRLPETYALKAAKGGVL